MLLNCLAVGLGGFFGSVLRYLANFIKLGVYTTLGINTIGSFAIMFLTGLLLHNHAEQTTLALFLRIGLCGGFTTFSTFSAETIGLLESGNITQAIIYALLSVTCCLLAAWAGETAAALLYR